MHKSRVSLVVLLALVVLVSTLAGCGRKNLIKINGETVRKDEFYGRLEKVPVQTQEGAKPAGQYVIEQMIGEKLVMQLAKKEGVEPTETQINKKVETIRKESGGNLSKVLAAQGMTLEDLKKRISSEQALVNVVTKSITVPEAEVKAAYDQALATKPSPFVRPEQVMVSAILTEKKDKADNAYKMLADGQNFGTVAMQMSDLGTAKQDQGKLNWLAREDERIPKPVREAAFAMDVGKYSKPMSLGEKGGWIIVKADQRRPKKVTSYDEVKDMIKEQLALREGAKKGTFRKDLQTFTKESEIKINSERYKPIADKIKKQATESLKLPEQKLGGESKPEPTTNK